MKNILNQLKQPFGDPRIFTRNSFCNNETNNTKEIIFHNRIIVYSALAQQIKKETRYLINGKE
ncbi:hypothetical protein ELUCI_v1c03000 [Williamsoniiplasma lucivorax]|uniref:Uncharacterized protein n=1 Tax=Williamsoniiplasma lucivorax TaxID=209274 RepID=A0A2S5RFA5_9MOLU|nr:hypothetical protein ELUCI_v1c03000 [Williamsoniiplasma lucivorax]